MGTGIIFPVSALAFNILMIVLLFVKRTQNTKEVNLYKSMIWLNFITLIVEICCTYASYIKDSNVMFSNFILKSYLVLLVLWSSLMSLYTFYVSKDKKAIKKQEDKYSTVVIMTFVISAVLIYVLDIMLVVSDDFLIRYTKGLSVDFTYLICIIFIFMMLYNIITCKDRTKQKKFIPVYMFIVLLIISAMIQFFYPQILLVTYVQTLVLSVMYHTIENPDAKIAELEMEAKEAAILASKAKSDFLSSMSHELRTPLNAIIGLSEDIDSFSSLLPDEVQEDSSDIINASNTLLEIVGNILDLNKIEGGKLEIVPTFYSPKEEIESICKIMRTKVAEKPLEFILKMDKKLPKVLYGDKLRIKQILNNLLSNAIKYTDNGKITFIVTWDSETSSINFSISDTGNGIKEEDMDKLFAKFERLHVEKVSSVQGTGLGLSITKDLIELMNGVINVSSIYGKGTTFEVKIPQVIGDEKEYNSIKEKSVVPIIDFDFSDKRILIVDDNDLNIKVLRKSIKNFNFQIDEARNGKECLAKVEDGNKYDLIFLDVLMPIMGGEETVKALKEIDGFECPVIALTADALTGAREKYLSMGFDDYLSKPLSRNMIYEKIASIFGNFK